MVREPELREEAVPAVADAAAAPGLGRPGGDVSPLPGPSGNVEFFLWLRRGPATLGEEDIHRTVWDAAGPGVPGERVEP